MLSLRSITLAPLSTLPVTRVVPFMNCSAAALGLPTCGAMSTLERSDAPPRSARVPRSMIVSPL
ncbi:hypothetical protein D3C71_1522690 [compost metagenome]